VALCGVCLERSRKRGGAGSCRRFCRLAVEQAPGGRYAIPAEADCRSCHEGAAVPVLGAGALQLSPDRDPLAPHAETPETAGIDLRDLIARGWLRYLPAQLLSHPPRIVTASAVERAALGYLHANCGHCHNNGGSPAPVGLELAHETALGAASTGRTLASMLGAKSAFGRRRGRMRHSWSCPETRT